jgi:pimeloyl-ACP methyl ester carboxylesterase
MNIMRTIFLSVAAAAIILVGIYFLMNPEKKRLDDAARKRLGGSYIRLSFGVTHYALEGPENGRVVVLVHGGTVPMFTWDELSPGMTSAGFRVLRYDAFGRGFSDRPNVVYNRSLYLEQLVELLDGLQIHDPVDIVGYSFGGATAANFTAHHAARVRNVVLISPVICDYTTPAVLRIPVVGEFFGRVIGLRKVINRASTLWESREFAQHYSTLFAEQTTYEGFQASLLSMLRSDALTDYRDSYAAVAEQNHRIMLIWGTDDSEITEDVISSARALLPRAEFHAIQGAGHGVVFQKPDQIQRLLIGFLQGGE